MIWLSFAVTGAPTPKLSTCAASPWPGCFGNLKQLFAGGQEFTYGSEDIGRYYRNYLELMRHWDAVLPGRVLHIFYEDVIEDPPGNVRRILEFCGLEFEPACVEFYNTKRSVHRNRAGPPANFSRGPFPVVKL